MSAMTLDQAIRRISAAGEGQEIAVFTTTTTDLFDCVFARTVATKQAMDAGDPRFVGVFSCLDDDDDVKRTLKLAARRARQTAA